MKQTEFLAIRMDKPLKEEISAHAKQERRSVSNMTKVLLREALAARAKAEA